MRRVAQQAIDHTVVVKTITKEDALTGEVETKDVAVLTVGQAIELSKAAISLEREAFGVEDKPAVPVGSGLNVQVNIHQGQAESDEELLARVLRVQRAREELNIIDHE
jgi:hypothetical protein